MLRPPYTTYSRLFVYNLDLPEVPEIDDPDFIGAWPEGETVILFFHHSKDTLIEQICQKQGCSIVYQADLDYKDWETGGEVCRFSVAGLSIAPVWDPAPADIRLDPSVIFGNGFHPTTRLCLEGLAHLLEQKQQTTPLQTAFDLGCGTGILAMLAARKGLDRITAIDYNDLACRVATANIKRNRLEGQVKVEQRDLSTSCPDTRVDLVVANLYHVLLESLFAKPEFWQARYYIISGFITPREENLLAVLPVKKLRFIERLRRENWGVWILERKAD